MRYIVDQTKLGQNPNTPEAALTATILTITMGMVIAGTYKMIKSIQTEPIIKHWVEDIDRNRLYRNNNYISQLQRPTTTPQQTPHGQGPLEA